MQGRFTKRNAAGIICFALVFCLLFALAERLFWNDEEYCTVWTRLREQKTVPEVLIVGNSHAFCSFVPDILNGVLGIDSAVLASSGADGGAVCDSVNAVLKVGKPRLLVIELNAFYFEDGLMERAHKYNALGNINGMPSLISRADSAYRELGLDSVPQGMFQLLRAELVWKRWSTTESKESLNRYEGTDVLGYQSLDWFASGDYRSADIKINGSASGADESLLDSNACSELRRLLTLAKQNSVEVWLIKAPLAARIIEHPNTFDAVGLIAAEYGDTVAFSHDYNEDLPEMKLTSADFYDGGHLNRRGAAKFTLRFADKLGERLGKTPDIGGAFAYLDEAVTPLEDGLWRYEMYALGRDVLYRFELDEGDAKTLVADWSETNAVDLPLEPDSADSLIVSMCPAGITQDERAYYMHTLRFMTEDACVLN